MPRRISSSLTMNRRQFTLITALYGGQSWLHHAFAQEDKPAQELAALPPAYAESAALVGLTRDGKHGISVRVGRFPPRGEATLWAMVCLDDTIYSAALGDLGLGDFKGRTRVEEPAARFEITGAAQALLTRTNENSLKGMARVSCNAHLSADPPEGSGDYPLIVEASFESGHRPVYVRPGRLEVMGQVKATLRTPSGVHRIEGPGKWHEQVGDRPRFAPAFTYLSVMGERRGLLATKRPNGAYGYAWLGNHVVPVKTVDIDPIAKRRKFRAALENGQVIEGEAVTERTTSVPIEGQRRPGATVLVTSNIGSMVGHLNDWQPKE